MSESEPDEVTGSAWDRLRADLAATEFVDSLLRPGQASGPQPGPDVTEDLMAAPLILDTDLGGDPDDAFALVAAARTCPELALVLTTDETDGGDRARFARWLLDQVGRPDVPVVAGARLGPVRHFCVEGLATDAAPEPPDDDVPGALLRLAVHRTGPIRWVGLGPLTNLATVLDVVPELAGRLRLTQMAGALENQRVEHNVKLDVPAARRVLGAVRAGTLSMPRFVSTDVTLDPRLAVGPGHALYRMLADRPDSRWAQALVRHLDRWVERFHPETFQHDPLALSAALGLPFELSVPTAIRIDERGLVVHDPDGAVVRWAIEAEPDALIGWLTRALDPHR